MPTRRRLRWVCRRVAVATGWAPLLRSLLPMSTPLQRQSRSDDAVPGRALVWNFWPRMIDTPGANQHTIEFRVVDDGRRVRVPDPRHHPRLRGFVEAMDRIRLPPGDDDAFIIDRSIESRRPPRRLGRLILAQGPVAPIGPVYDPLTQGARVTAPAVHHVALMRAPEIVVRYLAGETPISGRLGYSGVFCGGSTLDDVFNASEPPTHDDWVPRPVGPMNVQVLVNVALARIRDVVGTRLVSSRAVQRWMKPVQSRLGSLPTLWRSSCQPRVGPARDGPTATVRAGHKTARPAHPRGRPCRRQGIAWRISP